MQADLHSGFLLGYWYLNSRKIHQYPTAQKGRWL